MICVLLCLLCDVTWGSLSLSFNGKSPVLRIKCAGCDDVCVGIFDYENKEKTNIFLIKNWISTLMCRKRTFFISNVWSGLT